MLIGGITTVSQTSVQGFIYSYHGNVLGEITVSLAEKKMSVESQRVLSGIRYEWPLPSICWLETL